MRSFRVKASTSDEILKEFKDWPRNPINITRQFKREAKKISKMQRPESSNDEYVSIRTALIEKENALAFAAHQFYETRESGTSIFNKNPIAMWQLSNLMAHLGRVKEASEIIDDILEMDLSVLKDPIIKEKIGNKRAHLHLKLAKDKFMPEIEKPNEAIDTPKETEISKTKEQWACERKYEAFVEYMEASFDELISDLKTEELVRSDDVRANGIMAIYGDGNTRYDEYQIKSPSNEI